MISKEKLKSRMKYAAFVILLISGIMVGCDTVPEPEPEPDPNNGNPKATQLTLNINEFIQAVMQDIYLWYNTLPTIDIQYETDSKAYFKKLLYTDDKWSFITDDVKALENSFEGIEKSYGWSLAFGRFSDTQTIFGIVEFVYPNTPAALAGIKRGDMIYKMNNADITDANYRDLLNGNNLSVTYGQYVENTGIVNQTTVSMTALELNLNPVQFKTIINTDGHKIGYLFYAQFIGNYNSSLDSAIQYFTENQITDLVLDLRYNPGGTTTAAQHLCSSLAPLDVVNGKKILVKFEWNDKWQASLVQQNSTDDLQINFVDTVKYKMNLQKLYVITGEGTASASELTITGLKPYLNLVTIGETTYGKYTASITVKPEMLYVNKSDYADFENWGIQPIILKYANSQGVTDFKDGFTPDVAVKDDPFSPLALGDKNEVMLQTAISTITGVPILAKKSAKMPNAEIFDRGFSKYDMNKREVLIDNLKFHTLK